MNRSNQQCISPNLLVPTKVIDLSLKKQRLFLFPAGHCSFSAYRTKAGGNSMFHWGLFLAAEEHAVGAAASI